MSAVKERRRFFFNLGALAVAMVLVVASVAFGPNAARWVGLGLGIAVCLLSLLFVGGLLHQRRFAGHTELRAFGRRFGLWSFLAGTMAGVAIWEIVGVAVFEPRVSRWLTLANGLLTALLASAGLVAHEISSERVVHVLEVVERPHSDLT